MADSAVRKDKRTKPRRDATLPLLMILVFSLLAGGGCAAAGLAAVSPMASIAGYFLDRGVDRTYAAGFPHAWEATLTTLERMEIRVEKADRDEQRGEISASAGGMTISGELTKVTGGMTRVALTVNGGIKPDKETAKEILDRVAALLQDDAVELAAVRAQVRARANLAQATPPQPPLGAPPPTAAATPATSADPQAAIQIQKELEALRVELAALREFRASLVREFGSLRTDMAARLARLDGLRASSSRLREVEEVGKPAERAYQEGSVLRLREAVIQPADMPESVLVVRMSSAGQGLDGRESPSQILRVDSAPSFGLASTSGPVAPMPAVAGTLRAAGVLAPVQSILLPPAGSLSGGSAQPAVLK